LLRRNNSLRGSDDVAVNDAAHLPVEMVMTEAGMTGIDSIGTTLAIGAEMCKAGGRGWASFAVDLKCTPSRRLELPEKRSRVASTANQP